MTLAPAPEATVVDNDPAQALLAAQADGLLVYRGFVSGNRYEVEAGGRHWTMSAADALLTVSRLRLLHRLADGGADLELGEIRDDGAYAILLAGSILVLPEPEVIHWGQGFMAGQAGDGQRHAGRDSSGAIADLLDRPSRDDQCRMVILGLMHGNPGREIGSEELADMMGQLPGVERAPVKKTIVGALGFGNYMSSEVAEQMIAAFGLRWSVTAGGGPCENAKGEPSGPLPEMPGLVRLRALVTASRQGWLRYLDQASPNKARWLDAYRISVGEQEYIVNAAALLPWLSGLRAFHESPGTGLA